MDKKRIYADNAATTKLSPAVLQDMMPYLTDVYGNPSSLYSVGAQAKKAVELAREDIAKVFGAQPTEIFFTSGGSEADNWAIKGIAEAMAKKARSTLFQVSLSITLFCIRLTLWLKRALK